MTTATEETKIKSKKEKCYSDCTNSLANFYIKDTLSKGKKVSIPSLNIVITPDLKDEFSNENILF